MELTSPKQNLLPSATYCVDMRTTSFFFHKKGHVVLFIYKRRALLCFITYFIFIVHFPSYFNLRLYKGPFKKMLCNFQ